MVRSSLIPALLLCSTTALAAPTVGANSDITAKPAGSQETAADSPPETLSGRQGALRHSGWYLGAGIGSTGINRHLALDVGVKGAWVMNRTFGLGFAAYAFGWDGSAQDNPTLSRDRRLSGARGGLLLQYIFRPNKLVHGIFDATVGGGFVCTRVGGEDGDECKSGRGFLYAEPSAGVELNATDFMRVSVSGGYRVVAADQWEGLSDEDLHGFVFHTTFAFGKF